MTGHQFESFQAGIKFYVYMKQFLRVTEEIKRLHDARLNPNVDKDEIISGLAYYLKEKAIILSEIYDLKYSLDDLVVSEPREGEKVHDFYDQARKMVRGVKHTKVHIESLTGSAIKPDGEPLVTTTKQETKE